MRWINDGAHIYVCGDANRMAKDVENTLLEVIAEYGAMDAEAADEFLSELRVARHRSVYLRTLKAPDVFRSLVDISLITAPNAQLT